MIFHFNYNLFIKTLNTYKKKVIRNLEIMQKEKDKRSIKLHI